MLRTLMLLCAGVSISAVLGLPQNSAQAQTPHRHTIVCFGDSLTAGFGAPQGQSYPDYLESDLIEQKLHPRIVNAGVDGNTTKDGLDRLQTVVELHADIVVLELGANDGLRGAPAALIQSNLSTMIEALQKAHAHVILAGIYMPPNYGPEYVKQFNAIYPALARKYKLPLIPFILKDVYGVPDLMSGDGAHPNGSGYRVVAQTVLATLMPLLKR